MPPEAPEKPGRRYGRIGRFEVVAHIASGGMGAVYRAVDPGLGREVALKVLSPAVACRPQALERFRREARHAARLRHPNIVTLYELGEAGGNQFLVFEYVPGTDLHEYIREKGRLDPEEARDLLLQAARALDHAHRQGVVHRDIKPSNFLLTGEDGRMTLKLTDFGLALATGEQESRVTGAGNTVGTVDYMAPEQARDSRAADIRSDLYSLGCTFFHMLAGRPPFSEGTLTERVLQHCEAEPPDVRRFNPTVPAELVKVLNRLLAKHPEDRYQTPAELIVALGGRPSVAGRHPKATPRPPAAEDRPGTRADDGDTGHDDPTPLARREAAAGQFERARRAFAEGDNGYGLELLLNCCRLDPGAVRYRQALRQVARERGPGRRGQWLRRLTAWAARAKFRAACWGEHHEKVLEHGEAVLLHDPWDAGVQADMAEAADALGLFELAFWLAEQARESDPENETARRILTRLQRKQDSLAWASALLERVKGTDPGEGPAGGDG